MKNKAIITSLIIIMVGIIALGIGWHKIFDASATKPNLIECKGHIDKNQDMSCDICGAILSGESDTKYKIVKNTLESGTTIEVKGDMPSNAVLTTKEITKEVATNIAKRYIPLDDDKVLYAYDISMVLKNKKYQPENYGKDVNITLTNLEIEDQKDVAVMHIIDNKSYEIMKLDELTKNKVSFKATSFSTYIVLEVATYNVTFTGTGNFEIQTIRGNKITNSTELVSGTNFTFVVTPKAGYGISGITTTNGTLTTNGDVLRKTAIIDNITQATTITVTTVAAPVVTKQPVTVKVNSGETAIYTVTAQNATTYEWQYRTNENDYWKSASEIGTASNGTLTITNVTDAISGYSIRCMLSNDSFDNGYEVKTDMAYVILAEGTLQMPVAIDEPIKEEAKMVTVWEIPANTTIKLPVESSGDNALNIQVDWGDGSEIQTVTTSFPTHTYTTSGEKTIKIWGNCPVWGYWSWSNVDASSQYYTYTRYLTKIKQFGELSATRYGFSKCTKLVEVSGNNLVTNKTFEKVTSMFSMFNDCSSLTKLDVSDFNTGNVTDMEAMFQGCSSLTSLDVGNFNTENVTDMSLMFAGCINLTNLDVGSFNTEKVTNVVAMFAECSGLTSLDLKNFNTEKVTMMAAMFAECSSLTSLDLKNFNTGNVTDMEAMFQGCSSLTSLDVGNFSTANVTVMKTMFSGCTNLISLDVSNFNTVKVTTMEAMFSDCNSLTNLDIGNFDTSNVTNIEKMFYGCSNLKSLQLSNNFKIPTSNMMSMFGNTTNLKSIILIDSTPLASQFTSVKDQLDGKTFYVPSKSAEAAYETSWAADFTADRIKPILELVGDENITINKGETYTDVGYTVAGLTAENAEYYTCYGYAVTKTGEVITSIEGTYKINYEINRTYTSGGTTNTDTLMNVERIIIVKDTTPVPTPTPIKMVDITPPKGSVTVVGSTVENGVNNLTDKEFTIQIQATDDVSTSSEIKVYVVLNKVPDTEKILDSAWDTYKDGYTKTLAIPNGTTEATVHVVLKDKAGNTQTIFTGSSASYNLKYDANGGTANIPNQIAYYGMPFKVTKELPTYDGKYFLGWSTTKSATVASYEQGETIPASVFAGTQTDITLYAVWSDTIDKLQTVANKVKIGDYVNYPVSYENALGQNLTGWRVLSIDQAAGTVKLISTGTPLTYYHPNNTDASAASIKALTEDFLQTGFSASISTVEDYKFVKSGFNNREALAKVFLNKYTSSVVTVRALTTEDICSVTGLSEITSGTDLSNEKYDGLFANGSTYWIASATGNSLLNVQSNGNVSSSTASELGIRPVVTLKSSVKTSGFDSTGRWNIEAEDLQEVTIIFDANGGTVEKQSMTSIVGEKYGTLPTPTREGYTFKGWYTSKTSGTKIEETTVVTTQSDHTLYAQWTENRITVRFNANGGTVSPATKKVTPGKAYGPLPIAIRSGYKFKGWYTVKLPLNDTTLVTETTIVSKTSDHTLYAQWEEAALEQSVIVTFDINYFSSTLGGDDKPITKVYKVGDVYGELPTPAREGYTFTGWYTVSASSGGEKITATTVVENASNHTLYARWTKGSVVDI